MIRSLRLEDDSSAKQEKILPPLHAQSSQQPRHWGHPILWSPQKGSRVGQGRVSQFGDDDEDDDDAITFLVCDVGQGVNVPQVQKSETEHT